MSQTRPLPTGPSDGPRRPVSASSEPPDPEDLRSQRSPDEVYYPQTRSMPAGGGFSPSEPTREVPVYRPGPDELAPPQAEPDYDDRGDEGHDPQGYDQPSHDQPDHDQPGYEQPEYDQPGYDQSGYDQPGDDHGYAQPGEPIRPWDPGRPVTDTTGAIDTRPAYQGLPASAIPAARSPLSTPPVAVVGVLLALGLLAVAAVLTREFLVAQDVIGGSSWSRAAADRIDGLVPRSEMTPVGLAAAAVGVLILVLALWPRRRTHVPLAAASSVYVRPDDVDELATSAAEAVPGVLRAESKVSGRKVRVVITTGDHEVPEIKADVTRVVQERLAALSRRPRVKVKADVVRSSR